MHLPNTLKALLIDFDGTLADSSSFLYKAYETIVKKRGIEPSKEEYASLCGPTIFEASRILQKKYALKEDSVAIYKEWKSLLIPYYYEGKIAPVEGAEAIFALAKNRWKLALVTSAEEKMVRPFLERHHFKFDLLICKEDVKAFKPDPEPYLLALKKLKVSPEEAIAFEDTVNGALSATRAGVYTFLIDNETISQTEHVVKKFTDIITILKKNYG